MPGSAPDFDTAIQHHITTHYPPKTTTILDVGAGNGKYARLLPGYPIDAVEAWAAYVRLFDLHTLYHRVFICDIRSFKPRPYTIVIFGAVIEHLPRSDAIKSLLLWRGYCEEMIVTVPWQTKQGAVRGNPWEIHHQHDLTPEIMAACYDMLVPWIKNDKRGLYRKR